MDLYAVTTILLVILITSLLTNYTKILLERSKLPPGPTPLPIIGTLHKMNFSNLVESLKKLSKKYGDIFTIYEGSQPVIVLCGYKAIKETLINKAEECGGRASYASFSDFTKGDDVGFCNGKKWKDLRSFMLLTLSSFGVGKRSFEERIQEEALHLTDELRKSNGSPVNVDNFLPHASSNVICSVVFGNRFDYEDESFQKLILCVKNNFKLMSTSWGILYNIYPNIMKRIPGPHHKIMENFAFLADYIKIKMEDNMKTLDNNNPRDFIDCFLIKMEKEKKNETTFYHPRSLVMNALDLFFGGTETVSLTLKYALLLLMKHPNVLAKVYSEIDQIIGQRPPNYEDRHNMPFTEAVINEIQRFADVVPLSVTHAFTMDTEIRSYKIKKGTPIIPFLTSVHFDKTQFDNPESFSPNNFLDENGKVLKKEALIPFSAGKRICPGKSLALMELFIFLTTLLQKFTIKSLVPPEEISAAPVGVGFGHIPPDYDIRFLPRACSEQ